MYIILAAVLISAAIFLFWQSARQKKSVGLPEGKIIYTDSHLWEKIDRTLFDESIALTGKPDFVIQHRNQILPVEMKSNIVISTPYDSHIMQLAAYCRLIDASFGKRPGYGVLRYPERTFEIKYTENLELKLIEMVDSIRMKSSQGEQHRSHQSPAKCKGCGYASICEEKLM